jgi:hypothetical protein
MAFGEGDYGGVITDAALDAFANGHPLTKALYQLEFAKVFKFQKECSRGSLQ